VAQFGSALALGARGRRFKSSHPDMQNILLVALAVLFLCNMYSLYVIYRSRQVRRDDENTLSRCMDNVRSLEKEIFELTRKNDKLLQVNIELDKSNRTLRTKLDKINTQVKQISDHFKTN
jgi:flagellar basal body-associated protein FliL